MNRKIKEILIIIAVVLALVGAIVIAGPSKPAKASDSWPYMEIICYSTPYGPYVLGSGAKYIRGKYTSYCKSDKVIEQKLGVRLQKRTSTSWTNVPDTWSGWKYTGPGSYIFPASVTTQPFYCFGSRSGVYRLRESHAYKLKQTGRWTDVHYHWGRPKTLTC